MKYHVYCGMLDFRVTVEASSEEEAVRRGKEEIIERLQDADFWARAAVQPSAVPAGPQNDAQKRER